MSDMAPTIAPKSDQLNADDLIAGPRTITIREVRIAPGTEQPVAVNFEGDNNKPYLPCKSMRRVMVTVWGPDASAYAGRSMTLYRDPSVTWGGMEVGGIRISHMSHMDKTTVVVLTATKKARKPFTVSPLAVKRTPDPINTAPPAPKRTWRMVLDGISVHLAAAQSAKDVLDIGDSADVKLVNEKAGEGPKQELANMLADAYGKFANADAAHGETPDETRARHDQALRGEEAAA